MPLIMATPTTTPTTTPTINPVSDLLEDDPSEVEGAYVHRIEQLLSSYSSIIQLTEVGVSDIEGIVEGIFVGSI